jgi:hypothetical protein
MSPSRDCYEDESHADIDDLGSEPSLLAETLDGQQCQRHGASGIEGVYEHDPKDRWSVPSRIGWIDDDRQERAERERKASAGDEPVDAMLPIIGARRAA